ncbi:D-serine ammonia-lyase [Salinicoccus sesuvii]|uniref:Probable D-serine dehydratase n=1 Tax=Salinicoccus sesuvii TaxID=868281 RepID=A0ABV7N5D9_9STAP
MEKYKIKEENVIKNQIFKHHPMVAQMAEHEPIFWKNTNYGASDSENGEWTSGKRDIEEAADRLTRFAPFIKTAFPETREQDGIIESPLIEVEKMKRHLDDKYGVNITGSVYIKADNDLPVSGSVKARGGIYEVLKHAEDLAMTYDMIDPDKDYSQFHSERFRRFFGGHTIVCGSTGNLGLSIGIISAALGFKVTIHMSSDAKQWKKDLLRERGVKVVEHEDDYSNAVAAGREVASQDASSYFVDDEDSVPLFLGYAVAALRLQKQLSSRGIEVNDDHPLYVHLPCGVGSAPGGISFGLKQVFGDAVHPVFAEPVNSPCMLLGIMTGLHDEVSVNDIGLDNQTIADGLAVGRPSKFVGKMLKTHIHSFFTVEDNEMYRLLACVYDVEGMKIEPSAATAFPGPAKIHQYNEGHKHCDATHIIWSTGGSMVPDAEWQSDYDLGIRM